MRIKQERILIFFCILSFFILFSIVIVLAEPIFSQFLFGLDDFFSTCRDPEVLSCIGLTIGTSFLATIASLFGIPLVYILARKEFFGKRMVESVIDLPIIRFFDAIPGIVAAMLFVSAPFFINPVREGFQSVDPHLENVARSLGASEWKAFYKVTVPIAYRYILSGIGMSWGRGISEFAAVLLLAYYPMVASTLI